MATAYGIYRFFWCLFIRKLRDTRILMCCGQVRWFEKGCMCFSPLTYTVEALPGPAKLIENQSCWAGESV
jgi:hypothetical protein